MRSLVLILALSIAVGCGPSNRGGADDDDDMPADACVGLECRIDDCAARGMPDTTISGTVFAPNGTLALFGVNVYIPAGDPGPLTDGVQCSQCQSSIPGGSIGAVAQSGTDGKFQLSKVPSGVNVPLVVQVGKWRRKFDIPMITACTDNPLPAAQTSLPKNHTQGDMPKIAMTSGLCDSLECLIKKLGVDTSEFTTETGTGRVNLFDGGGFDSVGGSTMPAASALWGDVNKLKKYDIVLMSCNCSEDSGVVTAPMLANMKAFADAGGRVFGSHYHKQWISGVHAVGDPATVQIPQPIWSTVATCNVDSTPISSTGIIDTVNNPKGNAFAAWMLAVMGSTTTGQFQIDASSTRKSCTAVDNTKAERWVYLQDTGTQVPQDFQFTTPQENPKDNRCGKVVFSDMHVSGDGTSGAFPTSCPTGDLTPQEKALAFMFFDIASCVGPIF